MIIAGFTGADVLVFLIKILLSCFLELLKKHASELNGESGLHFQSQSFREKYPFLYSYTFYCQNCRIIPL